MINTTQKHLIPAAPVKSIMKTACAAQCQPKDFNPEDWVQTHNPSTDFSIQEESWLCWKEAIRTHLRTLPQHPLMTLFCCIWKPREEDIPQILPLWWSGFRAIEKDLNTSNQSICISKENCCQRCSKETLACRDVTWPEAVIQTYQ